MPEMFDAFMPYVIFTRLRFGRWDELLKLEKPNAKLLASTALWHWGRAQAFAAKGDKSGAGRESSLFQEARGKVPATSPWMNSKAVDVLNLADAILRARLAAWDVAVAADVLIYFGELAEPLAAVFRSLRPGGWFVFSVEAGETAPFELRATRRYAHECGWLREAAAAQGFEVLRFDDVVLRTESRADVAGHLVVLRKPG